MEQKNEHDFIVWNHIWVFRIPWRSKFMYLEIKNAFQFTTHVTYTILDLAICHFEIKIVRIISNAYIIASILYTYCVMHLPSLINTWRFMKLNKHYFTIILHFFPLNLEKMHWQSLYKYFYFYPEICLRMIKKQLVLAK